MTSFQVETEALIGAASLVAKSALHGRGAEAGLSGSAGALDGTPAMFAYAAFLAGAQTGLASLQQATSALSRSLNEAATAYALADSSAAHSLQVSGP